MILKAVNEMNINLIRQDGLNITGFAMVDYKNYNVAKQIGDTIQTNVPFSDLKPMPVSYNTFYCFFVLKFDFIDWF